MYRDPTSPSDTVALNRCQDLPPVAVVTTVAPVGAQQTLYVATFDRLYAVHTSGGTVRWCQQVQPTEERIQQWSVRHDIHRDRPPMLHFGTPRVANGVVYVCVSGYGMYTCAFNAGDGLLRWCTPTDAWQVAMPFGDYAVPVVREGIVYSGTYALNEQDGTVLWRIADDTGWFSPQALVDGTLYAITQMGIHAINTQNGEARWYYATPMTPGGPLVVADQLLYVGTLGSVDHPEKSRFYALDAETGTLRWQYPLDNSYVGAVIDNESIYVSSRDQHLYALEKHSRSLRWKYRFIYPTYNTATIVGNVMYINIDGAYALSSVDGTVLWHQPLGSSRGVSFTPSVVLDGVVSLASIDGHGRSVLYALDASNGTEYWHTHYPHQIIPLAVAQ